MLASKNILYWKILFDEAFDHYAAKNSFLIAILAKYNNYLWAIFLGLSETWAVFHPPDCNTYLYNV
jgi:hypothetical protein